MATFVFSDESVNVYGTWVKTEGIELSAFLKNPVMLYGHDRSRMPIGKWENVRIEGDKLMGDPVFDESDEYAQEVKRKVDNGFLNAVSIGFDVVEMSEDPMLMKPGQTRAAITKAELVEVSIVDFPANRNSVRLSLAQKRLSFSDDISSEVLDTIMPKLPTMKNIAIKLGLTEDATEAQVLDAIGTLQTEKETLKVCADKSVETVLALGRSKGMITDANAAHYQKLAAADLDSTLALVESYEAAKPQADGNATTEAQATISQTIRDMKLGAPAPSDERESWTYLDWAKKDPKGLQELMTNNPEKFEALAAPMRG